MSGPKPCPKCNSRGEDPRKAIRFLMMCEDGPFWYACDLCGYHSSTQETPREAAKVWNQENREEEAGKALETKAVTTRRTKT